MLDRPSEAGLEHYGGCSGVFVDSTHVLTAAHCVFETYSDAWKYADGSYQAPDEIETTYGTDMGLGYVCYSNGPTGIQTWPPTYEFGDECEFVNTRVVNGAYINTSNPAGSTGINNDFAVMEINTDNFPSGMGAGRWMALSSIDDPNILETKTPVTHGYPGATPSGNANWGRAAAKDAGTGGIWYVWGAHQLWTHGIVSSTTTSKKLKTSLDGGSGQSGSPIFYYTDNDIEYHGQSHYIIGIFTINHMNIDGDTTFPTDWNGGATVKRFRDFVIIFIGS